VLLWGAPPGRAALDRLAATLFDTVSEPFQIGTHCFTVCPSIGVAMWPADGMTAERLIEHADAAMYRAKRQHSGHAFFDDVAEDREAQ
jgi:predicted signal transduction protein with EAL and GGDEF domain